MLLYNDNSRLLSTKKCIPSLKTAFVGDLFTPYGAEYGGKACSREREIKHKATKERPLKSTGYRQTVAHGW